MYWLSVLLMLWYLILSLSINLSSSSRSVTLTLRDNHFRQLVRHVNHEARRVQQSVLLYASVSSSDEEALQTFLAVSHTYCSATPMNMDECKKTLEEMLQQFQRHCAVQNFTSRVEKHVVKVIDAGFDMRMQERELAVGESSLLEVCNCDESEKKRSKTNLGGDVAVLISGFWFAPKTKYFDHSSGIVGNIDEETIARNNSYLAWLNHSLSINMPYMFFGDPNSFEMMFQKRRNFPTLFVPHLPDNFYISDKAYPDLFVDEKHIPSKLLGRIWLEKMNLVKLAYEMEPNSQFYVWIDAGIVSYRNYDAPPGEWSKEILLSLPKDRISYGSVQSDYHSYAATVVVFPQLMVRIAHYIFYGLWEKCLIEVHDWRCGSDQYIWSLALWNYPEMFHPITYDYGDIQFLWGSNQ